MITLHERNKYTIERRRELRDARTRTGVACDRCGAELYRIMPDDDRSWWKGPLGTIGASERVYCSNQDCRFQGLMEVLE